jgi:DNA-binding MarR family transcriptional regulator
MNTQDIRTLKILEAIDRHESPSQRDMAQSLDVSLGLVNSLVRRLTKKGYFKITHLPKNRIRYILTPVGMAEKTRLTYAYLRYSYRFYRDARQKTRQLFHEMHAEGYNKIAFFGAGDLSEIAYLSLQEFDLEFITVSDFDTNGRSFFGHPVVCLDELIDIQFDALVVTKDHADENLTNQLIENGIEAEKIKTL